MAQLANITVYDGASTPAAHTLKAVSVTREKGRVIALWREDVAGVPMYAQVSLTATIERLKSGIYKSVLRLQVPIQEVVTGSNAAGYSAAPKVAYVNTMEATAYSHERSDSTGRRLIRKMMSNLLDNWTATSPAATTGPAPDLFDSLVTPS